MTGVSVGPRRDLGRPSKPKRQATSECCWWWQARQPIRGQVHALGAVIGEGSLIVGWHHNQHAH